MNLNAQFPQVTSPFVNENGRIDQAWLQLLITLWNRTGGGGGAGTIKSILFDHGLTATPNPLVDGTNPVSEASLAKIPVGDLLANVGISGGFPNPTSLSDLLDNVFGTAVSQIIYRGATAWITEVSEVTAGTYTKATITVDAQGIVQSATAGILQPVFITSPSNECIGVPMTGGLLPLVTGGLA